MKISIENKENAAVAWAKGKKQSFYEDSFRLLTKDIGLVEKAARGEIFAIFDGIGRAKFGRHSAQMMSESLIECFKNPESILRNRESLYSYLFKVNMEIERLDMDSTGYAPEAGCAGTVLWIAGDSAHVFHAGDTSAVRIIGRNKGLLTFEHRNSGGYLTRYFGQGSKFQMDVQSMMIKEGDRICLMTDGVGSVVHPVHAAMSFDECPDLASTVRRITKKALSCGSVDDITVLCIDIDELWK